MIKTSKRIISLALLLTMTLIVLIGCGSASGKKGTQIGVIGAMDEEVASLQASMTKVKITKIAGMEFCEGKLDDKDVVVVKSGIGKVNAGICAQILISTFKVNKIINTGVAGSLDTKVSIGDFVISTDAVEHDYDLTPIGYRPGEVDPINVVGIPADVELRASAMEAVKAVAPDVSAFEGRVCSGDQFIAGKEQKEKITSVFGGLCCEMEGGAIAHVCYQNNTPFVIIRTISDNADGSGSDDYNKFKDDAAKKCADITRYIISNS